MDKLSLNLDLAYHLVAAEEAIDAALQAQAVLLARLAQAGGLAGVAAPVGDRAISRAAAAAAALAGARSESAACHRALAEVQAALGLPAVAVGQGDKDPPVYDRPHKPKARLPDRSGAGRVALASQGRGGMAGAG